MENIWVNKNDLNRRRVVDEEKPVLDEHRSRIITFDKFLPQKPVEKAPFSYLRQRGYELIGQIGRGGYGAVYKARSLQDLSKFYAIKVNYDIVSRSTLYLEVAFFHLIRKRSNLPKIVDFFIVQNSPHMVLQFFQHQQYIDVFDSIKTLQQLKHYMIELLKGLNTLKSMGIFHRDIKPQNFLYNMKKKRGIIADFGLAQIDSSFITMYIEKKFVSYKKKIPELQRKTNKRFIQLKQQYNLYKKIESANLENGIGKLGTQSYCCIQTILHYEEQGYQCEMWSVGVIFIQFLTQKMHFFNQIKINKTNQPKYATILIMQLATLFGADTVKDYIEKMGWSLTLPKQMDQKINIKQIIQLKSLDQSQNQKAFDLLIKLLKLNRNERITVEEAIWHPFFDEVRQQHFESYTQKKWFIRQMKKRSGEPASEKQSEQNQQVQGKSCSLNQPSIEHEKSVTKALKDSQMNEQNSSEKLRSQKVQKKKKREKNSSESDEDSQKKSKKIKKKKKQKKRYFESEQECKQASKHEEKVCQPAQKFSKKQNNNFEKQPQKNIYETIRKYIPIQKKQQNKSNRIDLNIEDEQEKPKNSKVKRNSKTVISNKAKQANLQTKSKSNTGENAPKQNLKKDIKNAIPQTFIDESLRKIIKQEQQRLKNQEYCPSSHSKKSQVGNNKPKPQTAIVYQPQSSESPFIEDYDQQKKKKKHFKKFDESVFKKGDMDEQSDHYFDGED